ncbi:MAG: UDP-3-O-(3-hydroxymyristoyl)glucosamine N-acyltransferase [Bacteroidales bacterium]|nr:UDP-3-O-(3-hydroxymyristoyl)glucosamine N-acyltransferase [Bacteroidales bacterium]
MEFKAKEIAEILGGTVEGNPEATVTSFARIESGKPGTICFFANPKYEHYVYECKADIIIVNRSFEPKESVSATMVRVDDAYAAVAALLDHVTAMKRSYKRYRGCRSRVRWSAKIGKKVYVGDFAYIGKKAEIGDYTKIYENVYVGDGARIGSRCIIYPGVRIYSGMIIGNDVIIHSNAVIGADGFGFAPLEDGTWKKIEHTGNVIIEDNVEIGANTCVDKSQMGSTVIRKGTKIDDLCMIAHNVEVGNNTVMAAQTGIAGSTKVGNHCVIAGQVGIAGHITIADNTTFGAQAGVLGSIKEEGKVFMGTPAIPYKDYLRSYAVFKKAGK